MTDVVIAAYRRSPFHFAGKGELAGVRPDEMAAQVVRALVEATGLDPATVEDLVLGCAFPEGEQGLNMAKLVAFLVGHAGGNGGRDGEPLLRLLHAVRPPGGGRDPHGRGRRLRLRRCREHEPGADDGLQSDAASRAWPRISRRPTSAWARRRRTWRSGTR